MRILSSLALITLAACNGQAGAEGRDSTPDARSYEVGGFEAIALAGSHDVEVRVGGAPSVRAEGPADVLDHLDIKVEGGVLRIEDKRDGWFGRNSGSARIHVTVPKLESAAIGGSGDMHVDTVAGQAFRASIGGSGNLSVDQLRVADARFSIGGSGNIKAAGFANNVELSVAGSGEVDVGGLASRTANVSVAGSGDAILNASDSARVSIAGSGNVTVRGSAKCSTSKLGSGNVTCGG
jgi:hypothetical protein